MLPEDSQPTTPGGSLPDGELLRRYARQRSEPDFTELVGRYVDFVYSAGLRQLNGDAHRAQDVAQVVFTAMARKAEALATHPVLAGWLFTATQHAAAKAIRTEIRRQAREQKAYAMQATFESDNADHDWERVRPVLDAALAELGTRDREAVLLRYFARRPFAEIGATLRLSEDAARMRVERALEKLRTALARRGVTSTVAALGLVLTQHAVPAAPTGLGVFVAGAAMTGSAAGAVDLLILMTSTKFIGASAAAVVLLALGAAFHQIRQQREAEAAFDAARQEHAADVSRLAALDRQTRTIQQEVAQLQRSVAEARAATVASGVTRPARVSAPATPPAENGSHDPVAAGKEFLARFPEVKQALLDRSFARIRARYEPLYSQLQLTPDQIATFEHILLDGEGVTSNYPGIGPLSLRPGEGRSKPEMLQALRELLGADGFQKYREASDVAGPQQFTTHLAGALYFTDEPLTAGQARQLGPLLARFPIAKAGEVLTRDWDGFLAAVRPLLTDGQFAAVARMRAQEEFGATMKSRMFKQP